MKLLLFRHPGAFWATPGGYCTAPMLHQQPCFNDVLECVLVDALDIDSLPGSVEATDASRRDSPHKSLVHGAFLRAASVHKTGTSSVHGQCLPPCDTEQPGILHRMTLPGSEIHAQCLQG